ncbi:uncharacterized protein K02A2.6-like isoform X1 [Helicoverpa zea]|uniref:uncharacterized protein K02A2.6-like isoform X1 n=2 Tax=Helicoverpa zea TaxID=7113 RepID=UPI001F575DEC|nr:uncharacterized protein K02A2.6-like isoform X1 [Helicoverpa zea]
MTQNTANNMVSAWGGMPPLPEMCFVGNLSKNFQVWVQRLKIYLTAHGMEKENPKRLKLINLGKDCEFENLTEGITVSKIIAGLDKRFNNLKTKLMAEDDKRLTLEYIMKFLLSADASRKYVEKMGGSEEPVETETEVLFSTSRKKDKLYTKKINNCTRCGQTHEMNNCPAYGKKCFKCEKSNHFSNKCRNRGQRQTTKQQHVNVVEEGVDDNNEDFFIGVAMLGNEITQDFMVRNQMIPMKFDTGAACNIIGTNVCKKLGLNKSDFEPCNKNVIQLDGKSVSVCGTCTLEIQHPNQLKYRVKFIVIDGSVPTLIGCKTCLEYNFVKPNTNLVKVHNVTCNDTEINKLITSLKSNFSELFDGGLGCLPGLVKIQLKENAVPVAQAARRVPFSLLPELREELTKMESMGVIEKVNKPTQWVNNLVLVRKPNGKLRICIDPRALNKFILQPKYQLPTIDEIKSKMQNAKVFALLDASNGFWMLKLDDESSDLCTFITPFGRYRFRRLPFGVSCAPEEFSRVISQMFENVEGVIPYLDDLCVYADSVKQLKDRLQKVLEIASTNGIKFNENKCKFFVSKLLFVGHIFTARGISPDPDKVQAVMNMERPRCRKDLERFLGMCNYLSRFIPNYSKLIEPLRVLLKKDTVFYWDSNQDQSVMSLKKALCSSPCLAYFDTNKDIVLSVDSSSTALGAVILQQDRPIAFGSRALTVTEQNYCQLEKEMLAIVYGCYKMHQYVYGRKVHVESDHKPLETLFKKPLHKVPARLQRMMLSVQGYNLEVVYKPGKHLYIADTLSRSCPPTIENKFTQLRQNIVCHVKLQRDCLPISSKQLIKIQKATEMDPTLKQIKNYLKNGWPNNLNNLDKKTRIFMTFRDELGLLDGIILKSNLIVIPDSMKSEILKIIHDGHVGVSTCKIRARSCVFWPEINKDLESYVSSCEPCAKYKPNLQKEPLVNHSVETLPWHKIGMDICTFKGKDFLIFIDYYSKYIEVCKLEQLSTACVILNCKSVFARHGIPALVVTDCGTRFTSGEFKNFAEKYNFNHIKTSPKHSQSNGQSESAVKIFKNIMKKCTEDGSDPYLGLLNYRNTPKLHMPSPAQLLYSRNLRSLLPVSKNKLVPKIFNVDDKYYSHIENVKKNYDKHAKPLAELSPGQHVYFKKSLDSNWSPGKIINKCEEPRSYLVGDEYGKTYRRNRKYLTNRPQPKMSVSYKPLDNNNNCHNHTYSYFEDVPELSMLFQESLTQEGGTTLDNHDIINTEERENQNILLEISGTDTQEHSNDCNSDLSLASFQRSFSENTLKEISRENDDREACPQGSLSITNLDSNTYVTRSGRSIRKPPKFQDYCEYEDVD